jgi:hypothetical protein
MSSEAVVKNLRIAIINAAAERLGRSLTATETEFINRRGGLIALESILDTIKSETKNDIERLLNSECS